MNTQPVITNRTVSDEIGNQLVTAAWALVADLWAVLADDEKPTPRQQWRMAYQEHRRVMSARARAPITVSKTTCNGKIWASCFGATRICKAKTVIEAHKEMVEWLIDHNYID